MTVSLSLLLLLIPALTGLATMLTAGGRAAKMVSLAGALLAAGVLGVVLMRFSPTGGVQEAFEAPWLGLLQINFSIGIDGINIIPLLLNYLIIPLIILSVPAHHYPRSHVFFGLINLMQAGMGLVFLARGGITFYLGWEAALIPIFFLAGIWGGEGRQRITLTFFIYTVVSSLLMLAALVYLIGQTAPEEGLSKDSLEALYAVRLDGPRQNWVFWGLFLAFAVKMPLFPFHTWQPSTYVMAPAPGTMLLSGVMLKMGVYGMIRWLVPVVPEAVHFNQPLVLTLAVIGIIYGSVIAVRQSDIKRLVAYSSFAHVGLMAAGAFTLTSQGMQGAMVQMLSHGVTVTGLFLIIEIIYRSTGDRDLMTLSGLTGDNPSLTVFFMILLLGSVALPLTSGFVGEFLLLQGIATYSITTALLAGSTVILSAIYMLRMFQGVMLGPRLEGVAAIAPMSVGTALTLVALSVLVFWIGIFPATFLSLTEPAVNALLDTARS